MSDILIRDVPEQIRDQIRRERKKRLVSQNELLVSLLTEAMDNRTEPSDGAGGYNCQQPQRRGLIPSF